MPMNANRKCSNDETLIEQIEALHDIVECAMHGEPPVSFIDSLVLTSLSRTLEYIDQSVHAEAFDFRTRLFMANIRALADKMTIRLLSSMNSSMQLNYYHPIAFSSRSNGDIYAWIGENMEKIQSEDGLPPDIDSTFSALFALSHHAWKSRLPPSMIFAHALKNIEKARRTESAHIFNTWFEKENDAAEEWESADIIAMSSVAAFFDAVDPSHLIQTRSHIFDRLIAFVRNPIEALWFSDFYHSLPMAAYMISRCHWTDMQKSELANHIKAILHANDQDKELLSPRIRIENDTDRLLYIATTIRLGHSPYSDRGDNLAAEIAKMASIPLEQCSDPLFIHDMKDDKTTYAASPIVSGLLKFEAMFGLIAQAANIESRRNSDPGNSANTPTPILSPYSSIETSLTDSIRSTLIDFEFLSDRHEMVDRLLSGTDFAIAFDICLATLSDNGHANELEECMLTHALGLCTYFLYDKIYDQELHPHALPVLFLTNTIFQMQAQNMMERIELIDTAIPECIQLMLAETDISYFLMTQRDGDIPLDFHAKKSIGTCLVPALAMLRSGADRQTVAQAQSFFEHFNLARQISDDAKDAGDDASANNRKITTMHLLSTQAEIEYELFKEILLAKSALDELPDDHKVKSILQKHLDAFAIKVIRAKWEFSIVKNM